MKRLIILVVGMVILGLVFAAGFFLGKKWEGYKITRVVDGDTLGVTDLRTGRDWRMRLWGIDAPEAKECGAKESKENLEKIVGGREPKFLVLGVDGFGRYVARLWVKGEEVAKTIVADGWARVDVSMESVDEGLKPSLADIGEMRRLEEKAKIEGLGIWGSTCVTLVVDVDGRNRQDDRDKK
ncbi:MAG: thermonuclease family protein [Microgenomates group bacterium]